MDRWQYRIVNVGMFNAGDRLLAAQTGLVSFTRAANGVALWVEGGSPIEIVSTSAKAANGWVTYLEPVGAGERGPAAR
jgi:hypothetical protein